MWIITSTRRVVQSALVPLTIVGATLGIVACGSVARPAPVAQGDGKTYVYRCPDDFRFSVWFQGDTAIVALPDRELRLPRAIAASGARYAAGDVVYWDKGGEAMLAIAEVERTGCSSQPAGSPWEVAQLLGFEFRGIGQEPGWTVEIDAGRLIRLVLDYGERRIYLPAPEPVRRPDGESIYEIGTPEHSVRVVIADRVCRDVMSGEEFAKTVVVTVDGREYHGCGRFLSDSQPQGAAGDGTNR